jgi:hypothetical protein
MSSIERRSLARYDDAISDEIDPIPCDPRLDPVTPSEIQYGIQKMKTEKAPGTKGIPPQAYKLLVGIGEDVLENRNATYGRSSRLIEYQKAYSKCSKSCTWMFRSTSELGRSLNSFSRQAESSKAII